MTDGAPDVDYDVVVVGGGAVGASCALHLERAGRDVLVLEADQPASKASGRAAGHLLTYSSTKYDPDIATYSVDFYTSLADDHDGVVLYDDTDFVLAHSAEGVEHLRGLERERPSELTYHEPDELAALRPSLDAPSVEGALRFDGAVHTDPHSLTVSVLDEAVEAGAELRLERVTDVDGGDGGARGATVTTEAGRYRCEDVVVAAGAWTPRVAGTAGVDVALRPRTSQVVVLEPSGTPDVPMFHAPDLGLYGRTEPNGDVLVGGGSTTPIPDPDAFATSAREPFVQHVADHTADVASALVDAEVVNDWAGRCSATPDRRPLIGESAVGGVYVCAGFNGGGVARAPFAGRLLADLLCGRDPRFDPEPYRPTRFDGTEEFAIKSASTNW
jgi:sarcosine oxidase subunit beta